MPIAIHCPNPACGKSANGSEKLVGHFVRCRHCQHRFKVTPSASLTQSPAEGRATAENAKETAAPEAAAARRTSSPAAIQPGFVTPTDGLPEQIGRFQVRARLGAGAFGTVYRAFDPQLEREVALKVPHAGTIEIPEAKERFLREAKASARLRHPHIVPVHDAGHDGRFYYIASTFIEGQTLDESLGDEGMEFRQAARIVRDLAEALAYAHGKGIVHRDVKPANVMVDTEGEAHLMDFGIAHLEDTAEKLTRGEGGPGTPAYMAPEQSQGKPVPASDQYSLGAMLYEMLCGQTPFSGPPSLQIFHHLNTEPPPPRKHNAGVPLDLQTICLKALSKQPNERYADCQEMANDLRRWGEGEVIRARRVGMGERVVRWCRRKPAMAALTAAVVLVLLVGTVISSYFAIAAGVQGKRADQKAAEAKKEAERADQKAAEAKKEAEHTAESDRRQRRIVYVAKMQQIRRAWNEANVYRVHQLLQEYQRPEPGQTDLRCFEWYYFWKLSQSDLLTLKGHTKKVTSVAFSPDGTRIASASDDKTVRVWDAVTGQETRILKGHTNVVRDVAFSPDGQRIACVTDESRGTVKVWNAATGQETLTLGESTDRFVGVAFSPDGRRIATRGSTKVKMWDADTGQKTLTLPNGSYCVAFSPDGKHIASAGYDRMGTVKVRDAATGQEIRTLTGLERFVTCLAFSPDGGWIASGGGLGDGKVKVWNAVTGHETPILNESDVKQVKSVAFSLDGKRLAAAGEGVDGRVGVKVWDVASGKPVFALAGRTRFVSSVAFSPDGRRIASGDLGGVVEVWDAVPDRETLTLKGHTGRVSGIAFSPDGKHIASAGYDHTGTTVNETVKVWNAATGRESFTLKVEGNRDTELVRRGVAFSPDGKRIVSGKVWDVATGQETGTFEKLGFIVAFSPDGTRIASAQARGFVKVWDTATGQGTFTLRVPTSGVASVSFSPDGKRIARAIWDGKVKVWDAATGQETLTLNEYRGGRQFERACVAFSPDGKRIASGGGLVKIWDAVTGQEVFTLKGHMSPVQSMAFSSDGRRIASGSMDGAVKVWDAVTGEEILTLIGHTGQVEGVAFSPDGKRIVSASFDKTVKVWGASPVEPAASSPPAPAK